MINLIEKFIDVMRQGGPVMWALLAINVLSISMLFERFWFWHKTNNASRLARLSRMTLALRQGDAATARAMAQADADIYGKVVLKLLEVAPSDAAAIEAVELQRPAMERFMPLLNTIITGAPMIGLIGTVIGLIMSFKFLSAQTGHTDPRNVGLGLAQALLNTVAGLIVAVIVLFPYNFFRAQIDRTLGRCEALIAAAQHAAQANKSTINQ